MMNTMMMNGGMGLMMGSMLVGITLWLLLLVVLIWALLTWLKQRWGKPARRREVPLPKEPTAQEMPSQRYGGSEINEATVQQMRERPGVSGSPGSLSYLSPLDTRTERSV